MIVNTALADVEICWKTNGDDADVEECKTDKTSCQSTTATDGGITYEGCSGEDVDPNDASCPLEVDQNGPAVCNCGANYCNGVNSGLTTKTIVGSTTSAGGAGDAGGGGSSSGAQMNIVGDVLLGVIFVLSGLNYA